MTRAKIYNLLFSLYICTLTASFSDRAPIILPDNDRLLLTWGEFRTIMGEKCTLEILSEPELFATYWQNIQQSTLAARHHPTDALRIILAYNRSRILHRFPTLAHITREEMYDLIPPTIYDTPETAPWHKLYACMSIMGDIAEIEAIENPPEIFTPEYLEQHRFIKNRIMEIAQFPKRQTPYINNIMYVIHHMLRYKHLQPTAIFCPKLHFSIAQFIAAAQQGHLICPVAKDFTNAHKWSAHAGAVVGINRLARHDAEHAFNMLHIEGTGQTFYPQEKIPFLQHFTQHTMQSIMDMLKDPEEYFKNSHLQPTYSLEDKRITLAITQLLKLYNSVHEVPRASLSKLLEHNFHNQAGDKDFITLAQKAYFSDPRDRETSISSYIAQDFDNTSHPPTNHTRATVTQICLSEWLNIDNQYPCSFLQFVDMCHAILSLIKKQSPALRFCRKQSEKLPSISNLPVLYNIHCIPVNQSAVLIVGANQTGATITVPTRWSVEHIANATDLHILKQSLHQTLIALDRHQKSLFYQLEVPHIPALHALNFFNITLYSPKPKSYIPLPNGSLSWLTHSMQKAIMDSIEIQDIKTYEDFQHSWEQSWEEDFVSLVQTSPTPQNFFNQVWRTEQKNLASQCLIFPQLADKDAYDRLPNLPEDLREHRSLQKSLSLVTICGTLDGLVDAHPLTQERIVSLKKIFANTPQHMALISTLSSFPENFVRPSINRAIFIIHQVKKYNGLDIRISHKQEGKLAMLERLAALHEGIMLISIPTALSGCRHWSSHDGQHIPVDEIITRSIFDTILPLWAAETIGAALNPHMRSNPFLQNWAQAVITEIRGSMLACKTDHSGTQAILTLLSEILYFQNQLCGAANTLHTHPAQAARPIDTNPNFYMLCQNVYQSMRGPDTPQHHDVLSAFDDNQRYIFTPPSGEKLLDHSRACHQHWIEKPQLEGSMLFKNIAATIHAVIATLSGHQEKSVYTPTLQHAPLIYCSLANTKIIIPIFCKNGSIVVLVPNRDIIHNIKGEFDTNIMAQSGLLTLEVLDEHGHSGSIITLADFMETLYARSLKTTQDNAMDTS